MRKIIGIIMPYIIVGFVLIMNYASIEYQDMIVSLVVGLGVGIWLLAVYKCIGTLDMKILTAINCCIFTVGLVLVLLLDSKLMQSLSTTIALLTPLNYICCYILLQHKPRLHMSYQHSYKNRKRRYF